MHELTDELNTLIGTMASEGDVVSSGTFTLDLDHADLKLQDYRLPDPALFILNLVASAVCMGSHQFQVESDRGETRIFYNGSLPSPERLPELFTFILRPAPHPALRELALALHGASGLPDEPKITIFVNTREGAWSAEVEGHRLKVEPCTSDRLGVKVVLRHTQGSPWARLLGLGRSSSHHKILEQLFHFCRHAPLDIKVNGQSKGSFVSMGLHQNQGPFARRFLQGQQVLRISKPGSRRHDIYSSSSGPLHQQSSILVGLATPQIAQREGFLLICRGVAFRRPNDLLESPLACAVVSADHLEKNLSQTDLVEDREYFALLELVRKEVEQLIQDVCSHPPLWTDEQATALKNLLRTRYAGKERPVRVETFFRMQDLEVHFSTPAKAQEQVDYYLGLDENAKKEAAPLLQEMIKVLNSRLLYHLDRQRWGPASDFLECLTQLTPTATTGFRVALLYLNQKVEQARQLDSSSEQPVEPQRLLLRYAFGWSDSPPNQSALSRFFEFERAVQNEQWGRATGLADQLEEAGSTPFLGLWLGFFALHRKQFKRAAALWYRVLNEVSPDLSKRWYPRMWGLLAGKIPLATQIHWQARRGIRQLLNHSSPGDRFSGHEDPALFAWSQEVWRLRQEGQSQAAGRLLLETLVNYMLVPGKLKLKSLSSPDLAVALPTS